MKETTQDRRITETGLIQTVSPMAVAVLEEQVPAAGKDKALSENEMNGIDDVADGIETIRTLVPLAVSRLKKILENDEIPASTQIRTIGLILDRVYGRPDASVKVTSVAYTVEQSRAQVISLVQSIRESRQMMAETVVICGGSDPEDWEETEMGDNDDYDKADRAD